MPNLSASFGRLAPLACLLSLLTAPVPGQTARFVGDRDHEFVNPTSTGSRRLSARVYYPSLRMGENAPIDRARRPYPVIVFIHGFQRRGIEYVDLAFEMASQGYIAVMVNVGDNLSRRFDDSRAFHPAIVTENSRATSFFEGAFDTERMALSGHSGGGYTLIRILAENPGYAAGVAFAPWNGTTELRASAVAPKVRVPVLTIVGEGDITTPWAADAKPIYDQLSGVRGLRAMYLLNYSASHSNVVAWTFPRSTLVDREVFMRSASVAMGFLDYYVAGDATRLEAAVGWSARAEQRLTRLYVDAHDPTMFYGGDVRPGKTVALHLLSRPGPASYFVAERSGALPTPFGVLRLDPASMFLLAQARVDQTSLVTRRLTVPADRRVAGLRIWLQGLGVGQTSALRYSNALALTARD